MKIASLIAIVFTLVLQGCASNATLNQTSSSPFDSTRACATNFSATGSLMAGQQFKTFEDFPRISQAGAFDSLIPAISSGGYQIVNVNKDVGIINAAQAGSGRPVPLNFVIQKSASGEVRVDVSVVLAGGVLTSADAIKKEFCRMLGAVRQGADGEIGGFTPAATPAQTAGRSTAPKSAGFPGVIAITSEQQAAIQKALAEKNGNPALSAAIKDAAPSITEIIRRHSCWNPASLSHQTPLNSLEAPGASISSGVSITRPMKLRYHPKTSCVPVARISSWAMPAKNALGFVVMYVSDVSGESVKVYYELVKQPNAEWLVREVYQGS